MRVMMLMQQYNDHAKNELQEYMQKRGLSIPVYTTARHGGTNHEPLFISIVALHDGSNYIGSQSFTKKSAENSAATKALNVVSPSQEEKTRSIMILNNPSDEAVEMLAACYRQFDGYTALTLSQVKSAITTYLIIKYVNNPAHKDPRAIIDNGWTKYPLLTDIDTQEAVLQYVDI